MLRMAKCNIISHRGSNKVAPQNTLPAFRQSILYGVDGFETDVHLSMDSVPVICHNYEVDKTSNGKGTITEMTLERLKSLDFGSSFHHSYKDTPLPTLEEFLTLSEKANLKILNIEIKPPKNKDYTVVSKVIEAVKAHGLFGILLISSFDPDVLVYAKDVDETCKTAFLFSPNKVVSLKRINGIIDFARAIGVEALHPHKVFVTKKFVDLAHKAGIMVNPWTVNTEKDIRHALDCGVDSIITDVPKFAKEIIEKY